MIGAALTGKYQPLLNTFRALRRRVRKHYAPTGEFCQMDSLQMEFTQEEIVRAFAIVGAVIGKTFTTTTTKTDLPADVWGEAPADETVGRDEAAKFLGVSKTTLHKYRQEGVLEPFKEGKQLRYLRSDLLAYLKRKRE